MSPVKHHVSIVRYELFQLRVINSYSVRGAGNEKTICLLLGVRGKGVVFLGRGRL